MDVFQVPLWKFYLDLSEVTVCGSVKPISYNSKVAEKQLWLLFDW